MHNLKGVLQTAEFINQMGKREDIAMMNYHCFSPVSGGSMDNWRYWGTVFKGSDEAIYLDGIGEMMKILYQGFGTNVVQSSVTGNGCCYDQISSSWQGNKSLSINAQTDDAGNLYVTFVNRNEAESQSITFNTNNRYKIEKEYILTADHLTADNNMITPDGLYMKTNLLHEKEVFTSYNIEPKTIAVLKLVPLTQIFEEPKKAEVETDISGRKVNIKFSFYHNMGIDGIKELSGFVLKQNADVEKYGIDDVIAIAQSKCERDIASFEFTMPTDAQSGEYAAIILNGNFSNVVKFNYIKDAVEYIDDIMVSETNNTITLNILYHPSLADDSKINVYVMRDNVVVAVSETVKDGTVQTVKLPISDTFPSGKYIVKVQCGDYTKTVDLDYIKKDTFTFSEFLVNQNDEIITTDNITETESFRLKLYNRGELIENGQIIVALYNSQFQLVDARCVRGETFVTGENTVTLPMKISGNVYTARIFIWGDSDIRPLTKVYDIR